MSSLPQNIAQLPNGALRDQKSRGRLPENSEGLEIVPIRQFHELAELRPDCVQSLRIQRLLITGWRSGHGACGKRRQSEGGETRLCRRLWPPAPIPISYL